MVLPALGPGIAGLDTYDAAVATAVAGAGETAFTVGGETADPTYGEITVEGALTLFDRIHLSRTDTLFDLGSGDGKVVLLAVLVSSVAAAVGIELDPERHALATAMLELGAPLLQPDDVARVTYVCGDAFSPGSFAGATVLYMLSNAFPASLFARFLDSIGLLSPKQQAALRVIVSSRPIPAMLLHHFNQNISVGMSIVETVPIWVATTWSPSLRVRTYAVTTVPTPPTKQSNL
jgi:hypothetical protein